ncbi:MAG: VOC family protein [Blastocatellia bacterium]|nr:VOC family protein [Blastocatellia bacterium]
MTKPTKFAHIVYRTRRFGQMLEWYKTVFGAQVQYQNPGLAFLTYDDEHHRFAFANMAIFQPDGTDTERRGAIGVDHVAYTYGSLRDLLETYARLNEQGIKPYWCIHHGISVSLYYADPDGNQIEFQVDSFETSEAATAFMHHYFNLNPLGVEFDPDDWLARLRAGTPESEFLPRQTHEPVSPLRGEFTKFLPPNEPERA